MEKRVLLAIAVSFLIIFLYQWFFAQQQQKTVQPPAKAQSVQQSSKPLASEEISKNNIKSFYNTNPITGNIITVTTPLYQAEFSTNNLTVKHWKLLKYSTGLNKNSGSVDLIGSIPGIVYPMWESFEGSSFSIPSSIYYRCSSSAINVSKNARASLSCSYKGNNVDIKKIISFYGNSYTATVEIEITNLSKNPITERLGINWSGLTGELGSKYDISDGILLLNNSRETIEAKSLDLSKSFYNTIDWFGLENRYFVQVIITNNDNEKAHLYVARTKGTIQDNMIPLLFTYIYNPVTIAQNKTYESTYLVFLGPKDINVLRNAGFNLSKTLYFGWANSIAKLFLYILKFLNNFIHNYGWTIVIFTILIKIVLFPLGQISYKSMKKMQNLQPKLKEIQEKYKGDKEKLYRETTSLYRSNKVNPFGGCLPMLIQIPVFIGLYELLLNSIELRQAPFIWWIKNLSVPDTIAVISLYGEQIGIHVLPLIMGASMFFQQLLTPMTMDQTQTRMLLWIMPIMLTVIFWGLPAGLVLYWTVNNLFSIGQQYYILKKY